MSEKNPKPEECQTCDWPTPALHEYYANLPMNTPREEHESWWMCEVCENTHIMSTHEYPRQHEGDTRYILQAINYGTNLILANLRR